MKRDCQTLFRYYFQRLDMFGIPLTLYYHEDQSKRRSYFGATCTILLWTFAFWYLSLKLLTMRNSEYQKINEYEFTLPESQPIKLNESEAKFFIALRKKREPVERHIQ